MKASQHLDQVKKEENSCSLYAVAEANIDKIKFHVYLFKQKALICFDVVFNLSKDLHLSLSR